MYDVYHNIENTVKMMKIKDSARKTGENII